MFTIVSLSDSDKHFAGAIAEYTKRIPKDLVFVTLKHSKVNNTTTAQQKDTDIILKRYKKHESKYDRCILLSLEGHSKTTEQWVRSFPLGKKSCFIIGGPHGLDEKKLLEHAPKISRRSLGKHTMAHGLAKLVLTEQIYRIRMIQHGRNYHY